MAYAPISSSAPISIVTITPSTLDEPFTAPELGAALRMLRRCCASGPGRISGRALHNLPDTALQDYLRGSMRYGKQATYHWNGGKREWFLFINLDNYSIPPRPIVLFPSIWYLKSRRLLPKSMMSFGAKVCALNFVLDLISGINHHHELNRNTAAVFLDIKKAYDNVQPGLVISRLTNMGIGLALTFVNAFLSNRSI